MNNSNQEEFNEQLASWKGASASFCTFSHSHFNILTIKLTKSDCRESLGLGLSKCSYVSGPVNWYNSDITMEYDNDNSSYIVTDEKADLVVKCSNIMIGENITDNFEIALNFK